MILSFNEIELNQLLQLADSGLSARLDTGGIHIKYKWGPFWKSICFQLIGIRDKKLFLQHDSGMLELLDSLLGRFQFMQRWKHQGQIATRGKEIIVDLSGKLEKLEIDQLIADYEQGAISLELKLAGEQG